MNTHSFELNGSLDLGVTQMPWEEFNGLAAHPVQRQTAIHGVAVLNKGVLSIPNVRHTHVAAMLYDPAGVCDAAALAEAYREDPKGTLAEFGYKADGHTRCYLWSNGAAIPPATLQVSVVAVSDEANSVSYYMAFDSATAVKSQGDSMTSTLEAAGIFAVSDFIKSARGLKAALDLAHGVEHGNLGVRVLTKGTPLSEPQGPDGVPAAIGADLVRSLPYLPFVKDYADTITFLDGLDLNGKKLPITPAYLAGYLAIIQRDGEVGKAFVQGLIGAGGFIRSEGMDPVYAIRDAAVRINGRKSRLKASQKVSMALSCVLNSYEAHKAGKLLTPYPSQDVFASRIIATFNPARKDVVSKPSKASKAKVETDDHDIAA